MFKCLGGPCPATFILLLFETPILTLCLLAPRNTWCGNACFGAQVSSKYGTWYSARVILRFMCVGFWAGVTYLRYTVLASPKKGETAVHCCDPTLSVLVMLVSRNVFHVVSALQSINCKLEPAIWSRNTGQRIPWFDRCQLIITWMSKEVIYTANQMNAACLCQPIIWSMAAMLRDSVTVAVAVVRTRPRAIPLAMITMRKSARGFPFLSYMSMGLRLAAVGAAVAPL